MSSTGLAAERVYHCNSKYTNKAKVLEISKKLIRLWMTKF